MVKAKQPILSIIIPAYNVEEYLERCLSSLKNEIERIEVIVVNDGSTDGTTAIAKKWAKNNSVAVIDKENGGHGSVINAGLKRATGKYVRILDGDDWLKEETLKSYLDQLEKLDSDIVLTDYETKKAGQDQLISFNNVTRDKKYTIADIISLQKEIDTINLFSIHTITIKLDCIKKNWGEGLLEKTFYEDQEWVARAICSANTFIYTTIISYQYFLGRDEQSVNKDKMFKHREDHERVINRLIELANQAGGYKKDILAGRIATIVRTHYWIYFYHPGLKSDERKEYKILKAKLKKEMPSALRRLDLKYKIRLFLGRKRQELRNK